GFEAGAQFYFSKKAKDLTLAEAALLAALPKAPNAYSPIEHPDKALRRRNLVIDNMLEDGKITVAQANQAKDAPLGLNLRYDTNSVAPWFAEEVRQYLEKKYGSDEVHEGGLRVYTSLDLDLQNAATQALRDGLAAYERRHGWKGNLPNVAASGDTVESYQDPDWIEPILVGGYEHALVTQVTPAAATVKFGPYTAVLDAKDIAWTGRRSPRELFKPGDVVYVKILALEADHTAQVSLEQDSGTQGALIALDNATGDILAMVGGRDFDRSKFNRATQALRQVGSSFKPYIYTAAIDEGYTPEDTILDAPVTFPSSSGPYSPHNYDNTFEGVITLRRALAQSRNIPALKLAAKVGIRTVIDYAHKFGITTEIPPFLPIALGAADMTVIEHTDAFTTFPNDGVRVVPRYIRKVTDYDGKVLEENYPEVQDVVSARTARIMTSMLEEVVQHGTGYQAAKLKHPLAGKTGTTNDFTDAWFLGFSPSLTCGVWVGFDEKKTLGNKETGAMAALPIWMSFMKVAIQGHPNEEFLPPPTLPPPAVAEQVTTPDHAPGGDTENH
ncbi:MAG TPA: penicillin-binding transpeptidase domain-containing protein, partial [Terriglobales bacterium]|nr:penicillin-binding transpeptidase domain-containing protein [Terriglobales bacterium]